MTHLTRSEQPALLSRQIARNAVRLARLVELNAPALLIERDRQLLAARIAAFPAASKSVSDELDEFERRLAEEDDDDPDVMEEKE